MTPTLIAPVQPERASQAAAAPAGGVCLRSPRRASTHVLRGMPLLDQAAVDAVRQWRYRPLLLNGQRWPFIVTVTVNFKLGAAGTAD